ncbi:uncharacterized protein JCM6883_000635, partial [Sporobolomyces salmoneus]
APTMTIKTKKTTSRPRKKISIVLPLVAATLPVVDPSPVA